MVIPANFGKWHLCEIQDIYWRKRCVTSGFTILYLFLLGAKQSPEREGKITGVTDDGCWCLHLAETTSVATRLVFLRYIVMETQRCYVDLCKHYRRSNPPTVVSDLLSHSVYHSPICRHIYSSMLEYIQLITVGVVTVDYVVKIRSQSKVVAPACRSTRARVRASMVGLAPVGISFCWIVWQRPSSPVW